MLYLDADVLDADLIGAARRPPGLDRDRALRAPGRPAARRARAPGDALRGARSGWRWSPTGSGSRLAGAVRRRRRTRDPPLADRLRDLLDARLAEGLSLHVAAAALGAHPTHLVRAFAAEFGLPPHRYLTGRRVDLARRLLLDGQPPAEVAAAVGFYDQAHLTRHFRRLLGVTPTAYARSAQ